MSNKALIKELNDAVDVNCSKLIDSYRTLLKVSIIPDINDSDSRDSVDPKQSTISTHNSQLLASTSAANIVSFFDY